MPDRPAAGNTRLTVTPLRGEVTLNRPALEDPRGPRGHRAASLYGGDLEADLIIEYADPERGEVWRVRIQAKHAVEVTRDIRPIGGPAEQALIDAHTAAWETYVESEEGYERLQAEDWLRRLRHG